jgi:hypothetical protein
VRFVRSFKQINARPTLASVTVLVHLYFYALRFSTNPPSVLGVRLLNTQSYSMVQSSEDNLPIAHLALSVCTPQAPTDPTYQY